MGTYVHDISLYQISNAYIRHFYYVVMAVKLEDKEYFCTVAMIILSPQRITFTEAAYFSKMYYHTSLQKPGKVAMVFSVAPS